MATAKKNTKKDNKKASQGFQLDDKLSLNKKSKLQKIFHALTERFPIIKQKKFYLPLILGHLVMFAGLGFYAHYEKVKVFKPEYVATSIQKSIALNDGRLFNSIIDEQTFSESFINELVHTLPLYRYLYSYTGDLPEFPIIKDNISLLFLDIIKGNEYNNKYNLETEFVPQNISQQLLNASFTITPSANPNEFIISTQISSNKWRNIPLELTVIQKTDGLKITKINNIREIFDIYNKKLGNLYFENQNYQEIITKKLSQQISKYIVFPECSVQLGEIANTKTLFIEFNSEPNHQPHEVISFALNIVLENEDNIKILNKEFKSNKFFSSSAPIRTSWNLPLTDQEASLISESKKLYCDVTPTMVNVTNGDYFDIRKK